MRLVSSDHISDEDREIQQILSEHPTLHMRLTYLLNAFRESIQFYLHADTWPDPSDVRKSLRKREQEMQELGIPLLENGEDWDNLKPAMASEIQLTNSQNYLCPLCGNVTDWRFGCAGYEEENTTIMVCVPPCGDAIEFYCLACDWEYRTPNNRSNGRGQIPHWLNEALVECKSSED